MSVFLLNNTMIEMKKVFLVAICMLLCSCYRGNLIDKIVVSHVEKEGGGVLY